jgi:hypothetical protein
VREKMWWWLALARKKLCWWLASFGESYHGDVLQYAKHLFSLRLPQMTKYCVMRECDNNHSWISLRGDLAFSHQHGIYGFKFRKRFLEISSRDHCVMRECDNIHSWISLRGDLAFSHQHGIYGFKFPKRFLEISSRDLTLLSILII